MDDYWLNPQYIIEIPALKTKPTISVIISLLQTESARKRLENDGTYEKSMEAISYKIYSIRSGEKPDPNNKYSANSLEKIDQISSYYYQRDVTKRFELNPGTYVLIPSMFEKNKNMKFLLRYFYEAESSEVSSKPLVSDNKNNQAINDKNPKPNQTPNEKTLSEKYDAWFYAGMNKTQIESFNQEAKLNTQKFFGKSI